MVALCGVPQSKTGCAPPQTARLTPLPRLALACHLSLVTRHF